VALGYGNQITRYELAVNRLQVPLAGLPPELEGLKVAFMADWHCGPHNSQDYLRRAVQLCNETRPDLILIPGDFISYKLENAHKAAELLAELRPGIPGGLLVSWGNHDVWHQLSDNPQIITQSGAHLLAQSRLQLTCKRDFEESPSGSGLWIVGVDDLWTGKPDVAAAVRGIPAGQPSLVLCHNPDVAEQQPDARVGLMLSGHTHGGQICLPLLGAPVVPSVYGQKYAQGLVQGPGYPVLVTRGVGVGGIPVRLGVPPEIVLMELRGTA
jgi:predicted MPP superfamily phosphohydrolase